MPLRHGVAPSVVATPGGHHGRWPSLAAYLAERFSSIAQAEWLARMQRGEVLDAQGRPVPPSHPFEPQARFYYWRDVPDEAPLPVQERIVFEDDFLVVADKPHFLPVTPKGKHVRETLLSRLRDRLQCAELSPLHRIDRETAGLVLLAKRQATRHTYQSLFARSAVHKLYEALAAVPPGVDLASMPAERISRLEPAGHFMQMREVPVDEAAGRPANAQVAIRVLELIEALPANTGAEPQAADARRFVRLELQPRTGKRHQLRVQMAALGLPLWGDRIYPTLLPEGTDDLANPLRLLAREIAFQDPFTGQGRHFHSGLALHTPHTVSARTTPGTPSAQKAQRSIAE